MSSELLTSLLRDVSRSFYLTLRILPGSVRPQISLAYLLARATDTIADTEVVPTDQRLNALAELRDRILAKRSKPVNFGDLARNQSLPAERVLLERCEEAICILQSFPEADRERIREVLSVITSGQELDLVRFGSADGKRLIALETEAELDDYAYRVAGCVGEFWTKVCRAELFPRTQLDDEALLRDGVRFGKGLQMVNILRDLPADLRKGRCYLPMRELAKVGLKPADLLDPANQAALSPLFDRLVAVTQAHLSVGWDYTNALPWGQVRVRLACAWPVLLGAATLRKLKVENVLKPNHRIKISRAEVRSIILKSVLKYPFPRKWSGQFAKSS